MDRKIGNPIERYAIRLNPPSTTTINIERLPPPEEMAGMNLQLREPTPEVEVRSVRRSMLLIGIAISLFGYLLPLIGGPIPLGYALSGVIVLSFSGTVLALFMRAVRSIIGIVAGVFLPPTITAMVFLLNRTFLADRRVATITLGLIVVTLLFATRAENLPFGFYRKWLIAHPRFRKVNVSFVPARPGLLQTVVLIATICFVAPWSPLVGILSLIGIVVVTFALDRPRAISRIVDVFALSFAYSGRRSGAPGVWAPRSTEMARRRRLGGAFAVFTVLIATSVQFYNPADLNTLVARGALPRGPVISGQSFMERNTDTYAGMRSGWSVASIALGLFLPGLLFLSLFTASDAEGEKLKLALLHAEKGDLRTEWEHFVEALAESRHVTTSPSGVSFVETGHLYIGQEPTLGFPVLLDKVIPESHCYLVGDSGSGKTALGLIPLIVQRIRGGNSR